MAKKFGKFLAFAAIASAAAGAYYYYKRKSGEAGIDDFDDFDDEDDISLEEYLKEEASQSEQTERSIKNIFPITLSAETVNEAKESLKKAVMDIGEKVVGVADTVSGVVKPGSSSVDVENFQFYDLSGEDGETVPSGDGAQIDIINMKKKSEDTPAQDSDEEAPAQDSVAEDSAEAAPAEGAEDHEPTAAELCFSNSTSESDEKTEDTAAQDGEEDDDL